MSRYTLRCIIKTKCLPVTGKSSRFDDTEYQDVGNRNVDFVLNIFCVPAYYVRIKIDALMHEHSWSKFRRNRARALTETCRKALPLFLLEEVSNKFTTLRRGTRFTVPRKQSLWNWGGTFEAVLLHHRFGNSCIDGTRFQWPDSRWAQRWTCRCCRATNIA